MSSKLSERLREIRAALRAGMFAGNRADLDCLADAAAQLDAADALAEAVEENFDKCRLVDRSEAEHRLEKGKGYMAVPHEECIEAQRSALAAYRKAKEQT